MARSKAFVEASHSINELSHSVALLEAENAKLREGLADAPKCETCEAMLDCDECLRADGSHKERRRLSAENAKLRELVRCLVYATHPLDRATLIANAAELGVEVTA